MEDTTQHTEPESTYHRRVVTTETVKRGDLYVPLADRFDKLERRVSLLTWVVIIDMFLTLFNTGGASDLIKAILTKLAGL